MPGSTLNNATIDSFEILFISSFTYHPFIRRYIALITKFTVDHHDPTFSVFWFYYNSCYVVREVVHFEVFTATKCSDFFSNGHQPRYEIETPILGSSGSVNSVPDGNSLEHVGFCELYRGTAPKTNCESMPYATFCYIHGKLVSSCPWLSLASYRWRSIFSAVVLLQSLSNWPLKPNGNYMYQLLYWLITMGLRLCVRTVATNGPIVHLPGDRWAWSAMVMMMRAGNYSWLVHQSSLAVLPAETSGACRRNGRSSENFHYQYLKYLKVSLTCRKILLHGTSGFTSHPKENVLRIFIALKNPSSRPGLNPRHLGPVASILTTTPPRRLPATLTISHSVFVFMGFVWFSV
jgi:hypothetical protein